ncbi:hypothetical protein AAC387_Pa03g4557 [Persea americana]
MKIVALRETRASNAIIWKMGAARNMTQNIQLSDSVQRPPTTENYIENIPNSRIHEDNNSSSPVEGAASSGNCVALEETATGSGVADPVPNAEPSTDEVDTLVEYMGQKPNSAESEPPLEVDPCPTLGGDSSPRLDTIAQFEERWRQLLNDYGLGENIWLRSLYDIRERWIPAYTRNTFSAGMLTSQQTENPYSFFDGFVNKETTLQEFIKSFDKATDHRYKEECEADFQTLYSNPVLKIYLPMEAQAPETFTSVGNSVLKMQLPLEIQAAEAYTKVVFKDFQEELVRSLCYAAEEVEGGWELKTYRVREYWQDTQQHSVTFNVSETRATCTCLMFESEGILCRHALKIFLMCGVLELPSYYLLERWTRNAKSRDVYDQQGAVMQADWKKSATMRYNDLCRRAIKCAEDGATSVEVYDMAVSAIERCRKEIVEAKKIEARNAQLSALLTGSIQEDNIEEGSQVDHSSIQINLEDPQGIITKGGPSDQTFDGSLEKRKGAKTCSVCKGHDHNKRKCPHLEGQREFMAAQDQLPTGQ